MSHDFDEHSGPYKTWSINQIATAWPQGEPRPDFRGDMQIPGLVYTEGIERASVGEGQLRLHMPKVLQCCEDTKLC